MTQSLLTIRLNTLTFRQQQESMSKPLIRISNGFSKTSEKTSQEWDKYYFDPDEWKIDSEAPWQWHIRIWTGPEYLENQLKHV